VATSGAAAKPDPGAVVFRTPEDKLAHLRHRLREYGRAIIAYSGGVDSTFLLRVASEELRSDVVALTIRSPTAATNELQTALDLARTFGTEHIVIDSNELTIPGYAENPVDRCFLCKENLYTHCRAVAGSRGIDTVADGVNLDDLGDYRPGLRAASEHGVRHPLVEAQLTKAEIRQLSRELLLPTWDRPASPCLSSRFPYGTRITLERLQRVGEAESVLHRYGFAACRVRFHDRMARLEVPLSELPRLLSEPIRAEITAAIKALGFTYVTVDLQGLRSGSLNEMLPVEQRTIAPRRDPRES